MLTTRVGKTKLAGDERVNAIFDVELTNCCNAHCVMCPRGNTPESGLMSESTFRKVVGRAAEYGKVDSFVMCGLGEPLLHPKVVDFTRMAAEAGLKPTIVTNASRLTVEKSEQLITAGLSYLNVSLGGYRRKTYEAVHRGLDFETVYSNVLRFLQMAGTKVTVNIQISPTEDTVKEAPHIANFWRARGVSYCFIFPFAASRGGSLSDEEAREKRCQKHRISRAPSGCLNIEQIFRPSRRDHALMHGRSDFVCYPKDRVTFISWQGNYHLCCSDYEKRYDISSVFDTPAQTAYRLKAQTNRANCELCAGCDFSGGDVPPRSLGFYARLAVYYLRSKLQRLNRRPPHPDLGPWQLSGRRQSDYDPLPKNEMKKRGDRLLSGRP